MMNADIIENYIEKAYGYAFNHTFSREEADELSQEILFTAVRELAKLKDESRFEPWFWGVARNVTKTFRRYMGKQRAMYFYDTLEDLPYEDEYGNENEELYDSLRTKIAMLSETYRNIIILYYYDGLSTKQISEKLNIPEGTLTWRLSEARRKLKKECTEMNETALRPIKMSLGINGGGNYDGVTIPWPSDFINDALSQNIFWYCYEAPKTVEELSKLCGVPAYYIEDKVKSLIARDAIEEPIKGKYQTDFIIYTDKVGDYCAEAETKLFPIEDNLINTLDNLASFAKQIDFYKAGKSDAELWYLYGAMAFLRLSDKNNPIKYIERQPKYDGNRFTYNGYMESGKGGYRTRIGIQHSANLGSEGTYNHTTFYFGGFAFRKMMYDNYINVCEKILCHDDIIDRESAARAIEEGYIIRQEDGKLYIPTPAFTKTQKNEFDAIVDKCFVGVIEDYCNVVKNFTDGYIKLFPAHLKDEAIRACHGMFIGLYSAVVRFAQERGDIEKPQDRSICDVLIQFKER